MAYLDGSESKILLSENLQRFRRAKGLTQVQVAEYLNINRTTYTKYETGVTEPNIDTMKKLAALFEVDVSDLISEGNAVVLREGEELPHRMTDRERALIAMYRKLDDPYKNRLLVIAKRLVNESNDNKKN